jgi:polysaccharide pyruvyl transferase
MYYLVGTTGFPNYGDELIAAAWLRRLAEVAPDAEVWLDCPHPGLAQVMLGGLHPRLRVTDTFWRLCWEAPEDDPWEVARWVRAAIREPGRACRWISGIELATRAEVVHLIGGGYIHGIWPRHYGLLAAAAEAAELSGGRAVMTGQGLSPVADHCEPLLRELAARFELVDVRDVPSAELVPGATLGGDDMYLGIGPRLYRSDGDPRREVMLCAQSDLLDMPKGALAVFLTRMLRAWDVAPERLGLMEGIPGRDRVLFELIESDFPGIRFYPFIEIWQHGLPAGPEQTWISTRFHPHLLAAAAGAAGVAVSINKSYYETKHRSLLRQGSGWVLTDTTQIPQRPRTGGFDPGGLKAAGEVKAALADKIYPG